MFTGIIEQLGFVKRVEYSNLMENRLQICRLTVELCIVEPKIGESIAINGVCLTVISFAQIENQNSQSDPQAKNIYSLVFDISEESAKKTNLNSLTINDRVNVERSLKLNDRLGGHLLQGHVETVGELYDITTTENSKLYKFVIPKGYEPYLIEKGSIAVEGISLTIFDCAEGRFTCAIIPHTESHTNLQFKKVGDTVNIETDLFARIAKKQMDQYVEHYKKADTNSNTASKDSQLYQSKILHWEDINNH